VIPLLLWAVGGSAWVLWGMWRKKDLN